MSIYSEINRIAGAKSDIADAIEDMDVTVPSGTKLDGMANLIRQIPGGSEKLNSTQAADAYDPTATYAVGDKVSYAGNVYSCISAISTPEAWDSTHWDQVDPIQGQIDGVRNTLNSKYEKPSGGIPDSDIASASTWNAKGTYSKPSGGIPLSDLASDVQGDLAKNVFIATYNVTTYADISAAFDAGKSIFVKRDLNGDSLYALHVKKTDGSFYFRTFSSETSTLYGCTITSDGSWSVNSYGLATLSSPTLTGTPKAPTAAAGTNTTQIATTAYVQTSLSSYAKATMLSLTLTSGSWSSATPPTQTLTATGVTASNIIIVGFGSGITSAQYDEMAAAKLVCTAQAANSITITAYGTKPTGNIPISVVILG